MEFSLLSDCAIKAFHPVFELRLQIPLILPSARRWLPHLDLEFLAHFTDIVALTNRCILFSCIDLVRHMQMFLNIIHGIPMKIAEDDFELPAVAETLVATIDVAIAHDGLVIMVRYDLYVR